MNHIENINIVIVGKGTDAAGKKEFSSSFVKNQVESIKAMGVGVKEYFIDDTVTPYGIIKNAVRLRRVLKRNGARLVHAHYGSSTAAISALASVGTCDLIISYCGSDLLGIATPVLSERLRAGVAVLLSRFAALFASKIIVKSRNLMVCLPKRMMRSAIVQPNGVDIDHFSIIDKRQARKELNLDNEAALVLFNKSGRGSWTIKCHDLAHAAFDSLNRRLDDAKLIEIANVPFDRMPLYLNAADVLLLTSLYEGSPNIVKEAMACNLPIVSVDCGDVVERLSDVSESHVTKRNPSNLASAMESVLKNRKRSNGRQKLIEQGLVEGDVAKNIINLYSALIGRDLTGDQKNVGDSVYATDHSVGRLDL